VAIFQSFFDCLDEDKWKTEAKTEGGAIQEYTLSYQNLVPSTSYTFRVIAYNKFGISYPVTSTDAVSMLRKTFSYFNKIDINLCSIFFKTNFKLFVEAA